jgi:hypothetical protein
MNFIHVAPISASLQIIFGKFDVLRSRRSCKGTLNLSLIGEMDQNIQASSGAACADDAGILVGILVIHWIVMILLGTNTTGLDES